MIKNDESLKEKFVRKGFWIYLFSFVIGPIGYATKMILSAELSIEQMGVFYGIISLITLVGTYNDLGLTETLQYFLPKYAVKKEYGKFRAAIVYAFGAQISTSVLLGAAFFFWADFLAESYFKNAEAGEVLKVFSLFFFLSNFLQIGSTVFASLQETKRQYSVSFIRSVFSFAFVAGLWLLDKGTVTNYAWAWIFPLVIAIAWNLKVAYSTIYVTYLAGVKSEFSWKQFSEIFKYALFILLTANVGVLLSQIDMQLIILILGAKDAGYYTNYLSLIGIPFLLITPLIGFLFPVISGFAGSDDEGKITSIRKFFTKYFSAAAIPVAFAFALFGTDFAIAFFWEKFTESGKILAWSAPFMVFNFLLQINFQILAWLGKIKERLKIVLIGLAFNVPLNLILIPLYGTSGSALAVGLSWIPLWYLSHRKCGEYRLGFDWEYFVRNFLIVGFFAVSLFFVRNSWSPENLSGRLESIFWLSLVCLTHIIAFVIANKNEVREIVSEIRTMFRKREKASRYPLTTPESVETTP